VFFTSLFNSPHPALSWEERVVFSLHSSPFTIFRKVLIINAHFLPLLPFFNQTYFQIKIRNFRKMKYFKRVRSGTIALIGGSKSGKNHLGRSDAL